MDIDPEEVSLIKDDRGVVLVTQGVRRPVARIVKAFPSSRPDGYVGLLDEDGREIGMIRFPEKLDAASRDLLNERLGAAHDAPAILEILSLTSEGGGYVWEVLTARGELSFRTSGPHALNGARLPEILVTDERGKRYRIEDYSAMDAYSKEVLRALLPDYVRRAGLGLSNRRMRRRFPT